MKATQEKQTGEEDSSHFFIFLLSQGYLGLQLLLKAVRLAVVAVTDFG
jgi:hypothetical protein